MTMTHRRPAASFAAETEAKISELLASMPAAERDSLNANCNSRIRTGDLSPAVTEPPTFFSG